MTPSMQQLDGRAIPHEERLPAILRRLTQLEPGESLVLVAPHPPGKLLRKLLVEYPRCFEWGPRQRGPDAWHWQFSARRPDPRTVSGYLCWDHRRMEALLQTATAQARSGNWAEARQGLEAYADALLHHADIEDEVLFPAYDRLSGGMADSPTAMMRHEHTEVRAALHDLTRAASAQEWTALDAALARLEAVVVEHHAKEEEILFPGIDETLDPVKREQLVEQLLLA